ncbi:MAG: T9SS type A sorting domain-containing protein [Sphingobacteriales bacterium]|nr:MAG: T9SS type A sorting domain-containing protein [Sphingobacteriales bacterium]
MFPKRILFLIVAVLLTECLSAQEQFAFRISFTDKAGSPPVSNPLSFLSQRAIDRRAKFGLSPDGTDQPVSPLYLDTVLDLTEGKLHMTSRWLNHCVVLLDDSSKILTLQGKTYINAIQYIAYYPGGLHIASGGQSGNNPVKTRLKTTADPAWYGSAWPQTSLVRGECLHDLGLKGAGQIIAVLDDGFLFVNTAPGFDSVYQSGRIIDKHNFVLADPLVYGYGSHGTQILSTMAGNIPGGYVGAAPDASYALYITEDILSEQSIEMDNFIAATERADSLGADVLTSSLGYNFFSFPSVNLTYPEIDGKTTVAARAVNFASAKGLLCVITAGNEGGNAWNFILTPGDADSALTVGSVDNSKNVASNSGYGPNAAGRTKPEICVQGAPAMVLSSGANPYAVNGTSVATPQAAGYAACLLQAQPARNPSQLRNAIVRSSHLYNTPDNHAGHGVPDFCAALSLLDVPETEPAISGLTVTPNPFDTDIRLSFYNPGESDAVLIIYDITGKVVNESKVRLKKGTNLLTVKMPEALSPGFYTGRLSSGSHSASFKLLRK